MSDRTELDKWFKTIWRDTEGAVKLAFQVEKDLAWTSIMFHWPQEANKIVDWILLVKSQGADVFYSPAIYKDRTSGKSENVLGSWTLWAELDGNAPVGDWAGAQFDKIPAPSYRIQSSTPGRQHCYWLLDELVGREVLEPKNRALAYELQADTSGWDASQYLRPPATTNYGHAKPERTEAFPVELVDVAGTIYGPSIIEAPKYFVDVVKNSIDLTNLPPLALVLTKGQWTEGFTEAFFRENPPVKGTRSDALMAIGYFGAEAGLDDSEIYRLVETADSRWGVYTSRTADRRFSILADIVERARFKHPVGSTTDILANFNKPRAAWQVVYTHREFLDLKVEQKWVFQDLLTQHGMGMIAGEPGVGKTQLSNLAGIASASGGHFLSWENSVEPSRTLLLSLEMPLTGLQKFLRKQESELDSDIVRQLDKNLLISPLNSSLPLDADQGRKFLIDLVMQHSPELIVIDSLAKSTIKSLSDDTTARQLNDWLQSFRNSYGVSIILIHHTKKRQADKITRGQDELFGSRFLTGDLDFVLSCYKDSKQKGILHVENPKNRYAEEHAPIVLQRRSNLTFDIVAEQDSSNDSGLVNAFLSSRQNSPRESSTGIDPTGFGAGWG